MQQALRKFLHDLMAELLNLNGDKVVWASQTFPKIARPFATIRIYSQQEKAMEERRSTATEAVFDYLVPIDAKLELQMFSQAGEHPADRVEQLLLDLRKPSIVDRCATAGVAFFSNEPIIDMTGLLRDKQTFEPRAAVDMSIRYAGITQDNSGIITGVDVSGKVDGKDLDILV